MHSPSGFPACALPVRPIQNAGHIPVDHVYTQRYGDEYIRVNMPIYGGRQKTLNRRLMGYSALCGREPERGCAASTTAATDGTRRKRGKKKVCIIITRIRLCLRGGGKEDECQCLLGGGRDEGICAQKVRENVSSRLFLSVGTKAN